MPHRSYLTRFKLTIRYVGIFAVAQLVLCGGVLIAYERVQRHDFDKGLMDRLYRMVGLIRASSGEIDTAAIRKVHASLNPSIISSFYYQIRLMNGDVVDKSENLGPLEIPADAIHPEALTREGHYVTRRGAFAKKLLGPGGELRVLTRCFGLPGGPQYCAQVASDDRLVLNDVIDLFWMLAWSSAISLAAVFVTMWFLVRHALAPVSVVGRQARRIGPRQLGRRIEMPHGLDEVQEMVETVNQMLDRLEKAFAEQGHFIANVSHELKTPLSYILGQTHLLRHETRTAEEHDRLVGNIEAETRRMKETVSSFLMLARANAGLRELAVSEVAANDLVMDAVAQCQPLARHREIQLIPTLVPVEEDDVAPLVRGDAELLAAMVENLIRNAISHSPIEGKIEVRAVKEDGQLLISVRDHGPGIPPEQREKVFERHISGTTGQPDPDRVGLGLAISRAVARMHGGWVVADNHPEGGAVFEVRLPLSKHR
jgi:two-component system OmpR family sensor kinase